MRAIIGILMSSVAWLGTPSAAMAQPPAKSCPWVQAKIVGGEVARIEHWPGQAVLRLHSEAGKVSQYFCGGTAIADRWVLTAAHCLTSYLSKLTGTLHDSKGNSHEGRLEIVLGAEDLTRVTSDSVFAVEQIVVHDSFRPTARAALSFATPTERERAIERIAREVGDDIALIRLARPWTGEQANLALMAGDIVAGQQVRVAGFGHTETNRYKALDRFELADKSGELFTGSSVLRQTTVETISQSICAKRYANSVIGKGQLCAGLEQGGKDSCNGDSGGPLVLADANGCPAQIGIVSWGNGCAEHKAYGVYTRVSAYADWIQTHTGPLNGGSAVSSGGDELTAAQVGEAFRQLDVLLGPAKGRVRIGLDGGNRVRIGERVVFEAESDLAGRLVILDIDAERKVTRLYPNQFTAKGDLGAIVGGQKVSIPGPDYPGFTAFAAQEPVGKGWLIALVVPQDFDVGRFAATPDAMVKGFANVEEPPGYMMRLWRQIEMAIGARTRDGVAPADELRRWGYAVTEYEILR